MIQLKDVLHQLANPPRDRSGHPLPAHIEFVTCNLFARPGENPGGELVVLDGVILSKLAGTRRSAGAGSPSAGSRPANEWDNGTRNLLIVSSGHIRKVHVRLITQFNHATVVY